MRKRNPGFGPFNPLYQPTVFPDGRVFIPTEPPVFVNLVGHKGTTFTPNPKKKVEFSDYAQAFVGQDTSFGHVYGPAGQKLTLIGIRDHFRLLRGEQLIGTDKVGGTFIEQKGLWEGAPEDSIQVLISRLGGEKSYDVFKANVLDLLDQLVVDYGQEVIPVNFYRQGSPDEAFLFYHPESKEGKELTKG